MSCFNQLPLETLFGIFCHLDIPDILRIRRVSRYLNGITRYREVWVDAHRKADFVRPPGPFPSQSAQDLENALIPSFRVARNLRHSGNTAQGNLPTIRKLREIRYTGVHLRISLVFGRFLFIALRDEVRCYDLNLDAFDCNSGAIIVHRSTSGFLESFHCASAIDIEGRPFACVVLCEASREGHQKQISILSLNVTEQSEVTLDLLHQFEHSKFSVHTVYLGPRVIIVQGRAPLDDWHVVALDVHARILFLLHSFADVAREAKEAERTPMAPLTCISTSSHLLLARSLYTFATGWTTYFQAFALPLPNSHEHLRFIPLSHSHHGIISGIDTRDVVLLHDAILDPFTQDTLITVRVHTFGPFRPHAALSKYGTLRLSRSRSHDDSEVGTIAFQLIGSLGQLPQTPFFHPSFNGIGRAFYTPEPSSSGDIAALEYDVRGDGSSSAVKVNTKVVECPITTWGQHLRALSDYDPYSGRICLQSSVEKYNVVEILDLAV